MNKMYREEGMSHQIDTAHRFSALPRPRNVVANHGMYRWRDGMTNSDAKTAVFDYGSFDDPADRFQVTYSLRMYNPVGGTEEGLARGTSWSF